MSAATVISKRQSDGGLRHAASLRWGNPFGSASDKRKTTMRFVRLQPPLPLSIGMDAS